MVEIVDRDMEIFDPNDLKQYMSGEKESEILNIDLPERYVKLLKM